MADRPALIVGCSESYTRSCLHYFFLKQEKKDKKKKKDQKETQQIQRMARSHSRYTKHLGCLSYVQISQHSKSATERLRIAKDAHRGDERFERVHPVAVAPCRTEHCPLWTLAGKERPGMKSQRASIQGADRFGCRDVEVVLHSGEQAAKSSQPASQNEPFGERRQTVGRPLTGFGLGMSVVRPTGINRELGAQGVFIRSANTRHRGGETLSIVEGGKRAWALEMG
jgi:hypothetical protein